MKLFFFLKDNTFILKTAVFPQKTYTALHKDLLNEHTKFCGETPHFVAVIAPTVSLTDFPYSQKAKCPGKNNILCILLLSQNNNYKIMFRFIQTVLKFSLRM